MSNPKIVYDPGTGPTTLEFVRPPRRVPAYEYRAVRHDNISSAGVREAVLERIDSFLELELDWVTLGADVQKWNQFIQFALGGGQFGYYPDSYLAAFTNYWLEDTNWTAAYKAPGQYSFKLKFRQVVS
jgi:hypothetical protein